MLLTKGEIPIKLKKSITFIVVLFLIGPLISSQVQSTEAASQRSGWPYPLINVIGAVWASLNNVTILPNAYKAVPSNIAIGYNEKVTIQVGSIDLETGNFSSLPKRWFLSQAYLSYSIEYPDGNSDGWFVTFDPPVNIQNDTKLAVTNATIALYAPVSASETVQSKILRIRIADTWVFQNIWYPELRTHPEKWPIIGKENIPLVTGPVGWFVAALMGGFGKYSGKIMTDYYYVDVNVKVKPFHSVNIKALPPEKLLPNDVISIPVLVQNLGNYNDSISFRVKTKNNTRLQLTQNTTIALEPAQQGQVFVGIASPDNFLDTGTLHSITLEAFSTDQPNITIATQNIILETQGLYISEENATYSFGVGLIILCVVLILWYWRRKISETFRKKPEKPWKLPEERQHLAELKRTDKNAYEQERLMMQDEYKSAILWYKDQKKQARMTPTEGKLKKIYSSTVNKITAPFKREGKSKKKPKKAQPVLFKRPVKKPKVEKVTPIPPVGDITKEKILTRIKREQERQLRRLQ
ncbi:MAG: hypothetical protein WC525_05150 [Candidatus Thermoplasmatota archaeon]